MFQNDPYPFKCFIFFLNIYLIFQNDPYHLKYLILILILLSLCKKCSQPLPHIFFCCKENGGRIWSLIPTVEPFMDQLNWRPQKRKKEKKRTSFINRESHYQILNRQAYFSHMPWIMILMFRKKLIKVCEQNPRTREW